MTQYQVGRVGVGWGATDPRLVQALRELRDRLSKVDGPYSSKRPGADWSFDRSLAETIDRVQEAMKQEGAALVVRGSKPEQPRYRVRSLPDPTEGGAVVEAARSQLGVPYVWADVDPAGGGSAGFDCSGLLLWAYRQVGVEFPHMADAIYRDPQVTLFKEAKALLPGDIVFYHEGRLAPGHADHIAIGIGGDRQIAAPSPGETVQVQSIDHSHLLAYGRVREVNGAL